MEPFLISYSTSCFRSHSPILWADSWEETMATQPSGCRWSSASRPPFWCTSTTITCCIMGARLRASLHDATIFAITEMLNVKTMHIFFKGKFLTDFSPNQMWLLVRRYLEGEQMRYHVQSNVNTAEPKQHVIAMPSH